MRGLCLLHMTGGLWTEGHAHRYNCLSLNVEDDSKLFILLRFYCSVVEGLVVDKEQISTLRHGGKNLILVKNGGHAAQGAH